MVFGTTILGSNPSAPAINMLLINNIKNFLFPFYKNKKIKEIFNNLNDEKKNRVMLVGGCVRNFLNNEKIGDIDLATTLTPGEVIKKLENTKFKVLKTGIDHGTLTLQQDKEIFEITTLREDISTDGRHAKVSFTDDWEKDSNRRDFTINAIYLDQNGKIFDPQNGKSDLKEKKIKFIGKPQERIDEDYLRIIRFLRFSIQYKNFDKDQDTLTIIKKNVPGILKISKERIFSEVIKIIKLENLHEVNSNKEFKEIFKIVFPEFKYLDRLNVLKNKNLKKHIISEYNLVLALLLIDESNNHNYFTHKYKTSNLLKDNLNFLQKYFYEAKKNKNFFTKDLKKNIFFHNKEKIISLVKYYHAVTNSKNSEKISGIIKKIKNTNIPEFPLTGEYLIKRGFKSGRKIGEVLKKVEKDWIKNNFSLGKDELNNLIKKYN